MPSQPWYRDGLRFQCIPGCGRCCTGEPGYVWVTQEELEALAAAGQIDVALFEQSFVRTIGDRKSLTEHVNGDCVFFCREEGLCLIYPLRPRQCRTYPFWESNLASPEAWQRVAQRCPGCGQGPLVSAEEIEARVSLIKI